MKREETKGIVNLLLLLSQQGRGWWKNEKENRRETQREKTEREGDVVLR